MPPILSHIHNMATLLTTEYSQDAVAAVDEVTTPTRDAYGIVTDVVTTEAVAAIPAIKSLEVWSLDDESASTNSDIIDLTGAKSVQFLGDVPITVKLPNTNTSGVFITGVSLDYTSGVTNATASVSGSISGDTMPPRVMFALAASFTVGRVYINY